MTAVEDAYRMGYAGWTDGHDDAWHLPFARAQVNPDEVFPPCAPDSGRRKLMTPTPPRPPPARADLPN